MASAATIAHENTARHTATAYPIAACALNRMSELIESMQDHDPQEKISVAYRDVCEDPHERAMWPLGDVSYAGELGEVSYYMDIVMEQAGHVVERRAIVVATWIGYGPNGPEGCWQFNLAKPALSQLPSREAAGDKLTIEQVGTLCAGFLLVTSELV